MAKIFIITGKGGVGKTSVAAVHAVRSAAEGKRTLLMSADMAHNLGDIFQAETEVKISRKSESGCSSQDGFGEEETGGKSAAVGENLWILELDPYLLMQEEYPEVNRAVASLFGSAGSAVGAAGDGYMIPGLENLFSLLKLRDLYLSGKYDRIIVDCAPTGETLSLLKLPELLSWYVEKFSPVGRMITRILTPAAKLCYRIELPDDSAVDELGKLFTDLVSLQELLKDPETCRVRLVCIPERMAVEETRRSFMYLNLYRFPVDAAFINRVLPQKPGSSFMEGWHRIQSQYLEELDALFSELPVRRIPWLSEEIRGAEAVRRLAGQALWGEDLFDLPVRTDNEEYAPIEGGYSLTVRIPGSSGEKVEVFPHLMDVDVRIRNQLRSIPLPGVLRGAQMMSAEAADGKLTICFRKNPDVDP